MAADDAELLYYVLNVSASNEARGVEVKVLRAALARFAMGCNESEIEKWISGRKHQELNKRLSELADEQPDLASILKKMLEDI